jgi:hypothetical protein
VVVEASLSRRSIVGLAQGAGGASFGATSLKKISWLRFVCFRGPSTACAISA